MARTKVRYPNIEAERARRGMTQSQLADSIGVTRVTYCSWQSRKSTMNVDNAAALARALGKPTDYLLEESKDAESKPWENA